MAGGATRREIAVVGNGIAGLRLCERLVELGAGGRAAITVFAEESRPAYDRVRLGEAIESGAPDRLTLRDAAWYAERGLALRLGCRVDELNASARTLRCADGSTVAFDQLVLATGSAPIVPPIPGLAPPGVHAYRTLDDALQIRAEGAAAAAGGARVAVLGGGLLGLEAARLLQRLGCDVVVIERAPHLLPRQLPLLASRALEARLRELGLGLRANVRLQKVTGEQGRLRLALSDGATLEVALLVVAVGVRPNDDLARTAGLACHPDGGIVVDDELRTSHASVFAIGECARPRAGVPGLAAPALAMADTLAANLMGARRRFASGVHVTRLKAHGLEVSAVGETLAAGPSTELLCHESKTATRCLVLANGRAIGAAAVGPWPELPHLHAKIAGARRLARRALERFRRTGELGLLRAWSLPDEWRESAVVCACHGVTAVTLRAALMAGARTPAMLRERTGAGTGCGGCGRLVDAFAGSDPAGRQRFPARGLGIAAAVALALVASFSVASPIRFAESVQSQLPIERLWSDGGARQVTGFAALALALGTLTLSLRRRWPRLLKGSLAGWRTLHGGIGVLALAAVLVHTGLRAGRNLDLALFASLLVIASVGALAGIAAALEPLVPPPARASLRLATARAHTLSLWPFPVLAAAHVLKVYWF